MNDVNVENRIQAPRTCACFSSFCWFACHFPACCVSPFTQSALAPSLSHPLSYASTNSIRRRCLSTFFIWPLTASSKRNATRAFSFHFSCVRFCFSFLRYNRFFFWHASNYTSDVVSILRAICTGHLVYATVCKLMHTYIHKLLLIIMFNPCEHSFVLWLQQSKWNNVQRIVQNQCKA